MFVKLSLLCGIQPRTRFDQSRAPSQHRDPGTIEKERAGETNFPLARCRLEKGDDPVRIVLSVTKLPRERLLAEILERQSAEGPVGKAVATVLEG